MPLGIRMRIMKWAGGWRRKKTPAHLRRSLSPSLIDSQPSAAKRGTSAITSSPSFSFLYSSILFIGKFETVICATSFRLLYSWLPALGPAKKLCLLFLHFLVKDLRRALRPAFENFLRVGDGA